MPRGAFNKQDFPTMKAGDLFRFSPDDLVLITDKSDPLYDKRVDEPFDESLTRSILVHGNIEPIVVCKIDGKPVVVDGRRRTKAGREANRRSVEAGGIPILLQCVYRTGTETDLYSVLVSANEHRRDDSSIEKAEKANKMLNLGADIGQIAESFGVTKTTVTNWLKLLELPPEERKAITDGEQTATRAIAKKPRKQNKARALRKTSEIKKRKEAATDPIEIAVLEWVLKERDEL